MLSFVPSVPACLKHIDALNFTKSMYLQRIAEVDEALNIPSLCCFFLYVKKDEEMVTLHFTHIFPGVLCFWWTK